MISKLLILSLLLSLQLTFSQSKSYANETVKFQNEPVPKGDSFEKCNITLINSSTHENSVVASRVSSNYSLDYNTSFYGGKINKTRGHADQVKYELIILHAKQAVLHQSPFFKGGVLFNQSYVIDTLINQSFGIAQRSALDQVFVNTSLFGMEEALLQDSIINHSLFVFGIGVVKNVTFTFAQTAFENCTLAGVKFVNSSVCLEPSVKLVSVTFINSTVKTAKKCDINSFKEIEAQFREVSKKENLKDVINEEFTQNILEVTSNLDRIDVNEYTDQEDRIKLFEEHYDYLDLLK